MLYESYCIDQEILRYSLPGWPWITRVSISLLHCTSAGGQRMLLYLDAHSCSDELLERRIDAKE
jgi:hypothetical protein